MSAVAVVKRPSRSTIPAHLDQLSRPRFDGGISFGHGKELEALNAP